MSLWS